MKIKNNKGFTLVEVLAVIVILVIIVAIAIPNLEPAVKRQECKLLDSKAKLIIEQAKFYVEDNWKTIKDNLYNVPDGNPEGSYYENCKIPVSLNSDINPPSNIILSGYLTTKDLTDGSDEISGYVIYNYVNNQYNFCFEKGFGSCDELNCSGKEVPSNDCK